MDAYSNWRGADRGYVNCDRLGLASWLLLALLQGGCGGLPLAVDVASSTAPPVPVADPAANVPGVKTAASVVHGSAQPAPVAILISSELPAYRDVADELSQLIGNDRTLSFVVEGSDPERLAAGITLAKPRATVAIGLAAAIFATNELDGPVVFCQVVNFSAHPELLSAAAGVSVMPAPNELFSLWKRLDPSLSSIGTIAGTGHDELFAQLGAAAEAASVELHTRVSESDQETVYQFRRLAPTIDGFLLIPDNRVLSIAAIRKLIQQAGEQGVQVLVTNPELLSLGATVSAAPSPRQIAMTVFKLVSGSERPVAGRFELVFPAEFEVQLNPEALTRFDVTAAPDDGVLARIVN